MKNDSYSYIRLYDSYDSYNKHYSKTKYFHDSYYEFKEPNSNFLDLKCCECNDGEHCRWHCEKYKYIVEYLKKEAFIEKSVQLIDYNENILIGFTYPNGRLLSFQEIKSSSYKSIFYLSQKEKIKLIKARIENNTKFSVIIPHIGLYSQKAALELIASNNEIASKLIEIEIDKLKTLYMMNGLHSGKV